MLSLMDFKSSMSMFFKILRNCSSWLSTSADSLGKSGLISRSDFRTIWATTYRVYHLLSAGTTYHGA